MTGGKVVMFRPPAHEIGDWSAELIRGELVGEKRDPWAGFSGSSPRVHALRDEFDFSGGESGVFAFRISFRVPGVDRMRSP